jgi:diguanylate cyclase (GGDEF)-like protein/PAS domain S-box-containing protein
MKYLSSHSYSLLFAILLTLMATGIQWFGGLQQWNDMVFDYQSNFFSRNANSEIVVVNIDDRSLESLGRWPWPRDIHAEFIDKLTKAEVRAVGLDILFLDPDQNEPEADLRLAKAIRGNGRTVLPGVIEMAGVVSDVKVRLPIPELAEAAASLGHVNVNLSKAGVARGLYLQANINQAVHIPAFAKALRNIGSADLEESALNGRKQNNFQSENFSPFTQHVRVPFSGSAGHYQALSYVDVLRSEKLRKKLYAKYILVGLNATGLGSRFATSVSSSSELMSGVEFNANVLDMLLLEKSIVPIKKPWALLLTALLVFLPLCCYRFLPERETPLISLVFVLLSISISSFLLAIHHLWFEPASIILALLLGYLLWSSRHLKFVAQMLFEEKQQASATLLAIGDAVVTTDKQGKIEFMNPAAENMAGYSLTKAQGLRFEDVFAIEKTEECNQLFNVISRNSVHGDVNNQTQIECLIDDSGKKHAVQLSANPVHDRSGEISGTVYGISDFTEMLNISQRMAHIATHDSLTELPNRVLMHDRLKQAIVAASRSGKHIAILFIDLDGFKKVNDGLGHTGGDLLLKEVALRLQESVRQVDTTARWGGDEFVIMLENLDHEEYVAEIAGKIIQNSSRPFNIFNQEVFVTPSIGISLFPKDGETADTLLARADVAMYNVKDSGRNAFSFYSKGFNDNARKRLEMEKEMHDALSQGDFEIHYQPQIDLKTNQIVSAEALLRWRHSEKGLILPNEFIGLAEDTGLIVPIGKWLVETVCQQLQAWREQGIPEIQVAVNLSPRQFIQKDLVQMFTGFIDKYSIKQGILMVEVTESVMMKDVDRAAKVLQELKLVGVSVALDDFGTGYSSLSYLKRFPIDKLKIDKSFVDNLFSDPDDANIVQAVIVLGHKMNMEIVAEGIETRDQLMFLKKHQSDFGQGYYFNRPLTVDKLSSLLLEKQELSDVG